MDKLMEALVNGLPVWYVLSIVFISVGMKFYYSRFKPLEDRTRHADCKSKNEKMDKLVADVDRLKDDMSDIKSDISTIKAILIQKFPNAAVVFSMKKSPRRLNELGEKVFAQIEGEKFLNENKSFFFSRIDDMRPKTELDVENAANFACSGFTDNDIFNGLKDFVYNAPSMMIPDENGRNKSYDITLGDVCYILSLPLRDMYLAERFKRQE